MFTPQEIRHIFDIEEFKFDYLTVKQTLVHYQLGHEYQLDQSTINRLLHFTESVLVSCIDWDLGTSKDILQIAGEISEILSEQTARDYYERKRYKFRSAVLYEMAGLPALSSAVSDNGYFPQLLDFFKRKGLFGKLGFENEIQDENQLYSPIERIICHDSNTLGLFEQGVSDKGNTDVIEKVAHIIENVKLDYNATDVMAFKKLVEYRYNLSTRINIDNRLFDNLVKIKFPTELWPSQKEAISHGLLDTSIDCWGMAAPTGTGKTFLTRLLILNTIQDNENLKILYLVPSKALVYEISNDLESAFSEMSFTVMAVNPQLTSLDEEGNSELEKARILVITPEKADLLLRLSKDILGDVALVVIDEAHHIESGTRGVLLELYLWRLKKLLSKDTKYVFLSAVAPNVSDLTNWLGTNSKSLLFEERANRMNAGVFNVKGGGNNKVGQISYTNGISIDVIRENIQSGKGMRGLLVQLCEKLKVTGPVLTVAKGKKECERLAEEMLLWLTKIGKLNSLSTVELNGAIFKRLDTRLEREMYSDIPLRKLVRNRIAYHHAGLPPRVRRALEDAIKKGLIDFVFATTTLAEGVNFPFSTVVVQSIALRQGPGEKEKIYVPITPRVFWNIAGRAGRPGFDKEGQVILFEPTLGLEKVNAVIGDYLKPNIKNINPVRSALSDSIIELKDKIDNKKISHRQISEIELDKDLPSTVKGSINLLRVGLVHAEAENLIETPEDVINYSFANSFFSDEQKQFANDLIKTQYELVEYFFRDPDAPTKRVAASLGLSLDTLSRLKKYIVGLQDWQIENFTRLFFGPEVNAEQTTFIISPISARMAELEGPRLGGFYTELVNNWLMGIPLSVVRNKTKNYKNKSIEDLISVLYSKIQYLLPWGLFAADILATEETARRGIEYNNEIGNLARLVDAGVPSFDALRLVNLEFERVDATRLYFQFKKEGAKRTGMDIFGWINSKSIDYLEKIVTGPDNRTLDYDFRKLLKEI